MKRIFISWSQDEECRIAETIKDFLMEYYDVDVFVSSQDISGGEAGWLKSVHDNLRNADYGIICMTRRNARNPWLMYEAGALDCKLRFKNISVLLFNMETAEVPSPLQYKQARIYSEEGLKQFLQDLGDADIALKKKYKQCTLGKFHQRINEIMNEIPDELDSTTEETTSRNADNTSMSGMLQIEHGHVERRYNPAENKAYNRLSWTILFNRKFKSIPRILPSVTMLDERNPLSTVKVQKSSTPSTPQSLPVSISRYKIEATDITESGFTLIATAWSTNAFYGIGISWLAIG